MTVFLQIFLIVNVFCMGVLAAIAARHAYAHYRPEKHLPEKPAPPSQEVHLSAASREAMLKTAEAHYKAILDHSAATFKRDLDSTGERLNKLVEHMSTEIVGNELERYRHELAELRKRAEADLGDIREAVAEHQEALQAQAAKEIEAEKERLIKQIDTRLADAVTSFLLETLQHNVDLGAQSEYLTTTLEEHKDDFKKEIST